MPLELLKIVSVGNEFGIQPVRNHPLPVIKGGSPEAVAEQLVAHFEGAIKEGQKSWLTPDTVLSVEFPNGSRAEISVESPPVLNA